MKKTKCIIEEEFKGEVIYGDTDSAFVLFRGRSWKQSHILGQEISKRLTSMLPWPMELKYEKLYYTTCLLAKKRYCGAILKNDFIEKMEIC